MQSLLSIVCLCFCTAHKLFFVPIFCRLRKWIDEFRTDNQPCVDSVDSILKLKEKCQYDYFQGSLFPGQVSDNENERCYIFKMSTVGPASGVSIVKQMQKGGELEQSWVCFDHVKRIRGWTTMAAHVYDPRWVLCQLRIILKTFIF